MLIYFILANKIDGKIKNAYLYDVETLKEAFYNKFPANHRILGYYEDANGVECTWESLTKVRLQRYVDYLKSHLSPNSVRSYCSRLKTVLNLYEEEISLPKDFNRILAIRKDASEHTYLNTDEINTFLNYVPQTRAEHIVRNQFIIGCLTGARHSDYIRFNRTNFNGNNLSYVSIKTHHMTDVPLSDSLKRVIQENEDLGFSNYKFTDVYFNRLVKRICRKAGFTQLITLYNNGRSATKEKWEFITSHTARRSFATNLYLHGVDLYTISQLCGHSSVEITKTYICCKPKIDDKVMEYFNSFSN